VKKKENEQNKLSREMFFLYFSEKKENEILFIPIFLDSSGERLVSAVAVENSWWEPTRMSKGHRNQRVRPVNAAANFSNDKTL